MGDPHQERLRATLGARERTPDGIPDVAKREMRRTLFVIGGVLAAPVVLVGVLVWLFFGFVFAQVPLQYVDEKWNSEAFSPGRWEAQDGEYWVELREGGTGLVRLPSSGWPRDCEDQGPEGDVTFEFVPSGNGTYGRLEVTMDERDRGECRDRSPFLNGGGLWYGGYNWNDLNYSAIDPDSIDLTLHRVDASG